ncbi:MAG: hypothetical protein IPM92_16835 [Saprospiraceae bacterium]|nr:hypothetical protein [Saprospiraceae bacterium]
MIDFIKLNITYLGLEHLEQCGLVFSKPGMLNNETGEFVPDKRIKAEYIARYKNLLFDIYKGGKIYLSGSIHIYFNDGKHNYNNFNFADLLEAIQDICQRFGIDPKRTKIHHLEFGINLYDFLFSATQIVNNLMIHSGKGNPPEHFKYIAQKTPANLNVLSVIGTLLKSMTRVNTTKGMRIYSVWNVRQPKCIDLMTWEFSTLADLTRPGNNGQTLEMLSFLWSGVIINDWTIREENLTQDLYFQLKDWRNPTYWTNLKIECKERNRNKFNNELNKYLKTVQEHSENVHKIINDSLVLNWCKNTIITSNAKLDQKVQIHP